MKKNLIISGVLAALSAVAISITAAPPQGYYDSLEGLSGAALKKAAKELTFKHTVIEYGDSTWMVFQSSDTRDFNGSPIWWDMYSNDRIKTAYGYSSLNIEHAVPNSWWGKQRNFAFKDIHHLNPSNSTANNQKANYPLGLVAKSTWTNGVTTIGEPMPGYGGGSNRVFEPDDYYKGDFARAYFYVFTAYEDINWSEEYAWMYDLSSDLTLRPWAYEMLLDWAAADPVSQKEYDRNEAVYLWQKNRNPFIDNPDLAEHIWGDKNTTPFRYAGDFTPAPNPDLGDDEFDDAPTLSGIWKAVNSPEELLEDGTYCILETENNFAMSYNYDSKKFMSKCDVVPDVVNKAHLTITAAPEDIAFVSLVPVNGGYALKISDAEGTPKGFLKSTAAKAVTLAAAADAGCVVTIEPQADQTLIKFDEKVGTLQYNKQSPRFNTYTSKQGSVRMFRLLDPDEVDDEEEIVDTPEAGVESVTPGEAFGRIFKIYDINGRLMNVTDIDMLGKGLYIVLTPNGNFKFVK